MCFSFTKSYLYNKNNIADEIFRKFNSGIVLFDEVKDYGVDLFLRLGNMNDLREDILIVNFVFFKSVITQIDAIYELIKIGAVDATRVNVRVFMEAVWLLEWILKDRTKDKIDTFLVSEMIQEKNRLLRYQRGSQQNKNFSKILEEIGYDYSDASIENQLMEIEEKLSSEKNNNIYNKLKSLRDSKKWYGAFDLKTIYDISEEIEKNFEYKVFYSEFSKSVHTNSYNGHIVFKGGRPYVVPIRSYIGIFMVINICVSLLVRVYALIILNFREGELDRATQLYQQWLQRLKQVPKDKIRTSSAT